ncbi:MAG: helix-turn-helix domain-containing protein [bacterium]
MIKNIENQKKYCLNPKKVSEKFDIPLQTLANWRSLGKNLDYIKIGRSIRYCENDVIDFLETKKIRVEK